MKKRTTKMFQIFNLDAGIYMIDMNKTCFTKRRAEALKEDFEARGYHVRIDPWQAFSFPGKVAS